MKREKNVTGWDGHFRIIYIPFWLWFLCYLLFIPTIVGVIVFINFFGVEDVI